MKNPVEFPSVGMDQLYKLPQYGGVYFAMQGGDVLYIGQSVNIRNRWVGHHKREQLSVFGDVRVHYIKSDGRSLYQQEAEWLNFCRPPLNVAGPRFYKVPQSEELPEVIPGWFFAITMLPAALACSVMAYAMVIRRDPDMTAFFGMVMLCFESFFGGGCFMWWFLRKVYKVKTVKE